MWVERDSSVECLNWHHIDSHNNNIDFFFLVHYICLLFSLFFFLFFLLLFSLFFSNFFLSSSYTMDQQKPAQQGQSGTGQTQQNYSNRQPQQQAYAQYSSDASAYYQQYQEYQQYQQYQQYYQYQQQQSTPTTAATTTAAVPSALPPSYSTPLPPPKSKKHQGAAKPTMKNPLSQIQAQYQSSMQIGAAAASALTSAL